ncbi:MAG: hypothetical protein D6725_14400 [Planctomycetota bacterium]|nr:MAG: hypothetical protein D6725_14400 [Planctomycetota bacterium]
MDELMALFWLTASALFFAAAVRLARRIFPQDRAAEHAMHAVVVSWSGLVVISFVLALGHWLTPVALLITVGLLSAVVHFGLSFTGGDRPAAAGRCAVSEHVPEPARSDAGAQIPQRWFGFRALLWAWIAGFGVFHVLRWGVLVFPQNWDSLAYHIPLIDHWVRQRTLYVPDCAFWYVPGNNELWGLWATGAFSGDFLVGLDNVPAGILFVTAMLALAGHLKIRRPWSDLAVLAALAAEPVVRQLVDVENDLAVAALFLAVLAYGVRYAVGRRAADVVFAAASAGLLTGVKYYALGYAVAAGCAVAVPLLIGRELRPVAWGLAWGVLGALVLGAGWYLRNWWATGTPLFPLGFSSGTDVWGRMRPGSLASTLAFSGRWVVWPLLMRAVGAQTGWCHLAALASLPVTIPYLAYRAVRRSSGRQAYRLGLLAVAVPAAALVYVCIPNAVETAPGALNMLRLQYHPVRFGLPLWTVSLLALAAMLSDVCPARSGLFGHHEAGWIGRSMWALCISACGVGVLGQLWRRWGPWVSLEGALLATDFAVAGWVVRWGTKRLDRRRCVLVAVCGAMMLSGAFAWGIGLRAGRWHEGFWRHYDASLRTRIFSRFVSRLEPDAERICVCDYRYYPFFGSRRRFDVCRPLWIPDGTALRRYLRMHEATVVVCRHRDTNPQRRYAGVARWIKTDPDLFDVVYEDSVYIAARIRRGVAAFAAKRSERRPGRRIQRHSGRAQSPDGA